MSSYRDSDGRARQPVDELTELRRFFNAHLAMQEANNEARFARACVEANRARNRLLALRAGVDPIAEAA